MIAVSTAGARTGAHVDGQTVIELETATEPRRRTGRLVVRGALAELGITDDDLSTQSYTDCVAATRGTLQSSPTR
jgi:hypothetical protein